MKMSVLKFMKSYHLQLECTVITQWLFYTTLDSLVDLLDYKHAFRSRRNKRGETLTSNIQFKVVENALEQAEIK